MIGEIIQRLYEKGFFVRYEFSDTGLAGHVFHFWKRCGEKTFGVAHVISDLDVKNNVASDYLLQDMAHRMKQVDDAIVQYKLLTYE